MSNTSSEADAARAFSFRERALFPSGELSVSGGDYGNYFNNYQVALDFVDFYPGFTVDITSLDLLRAKLAAVATVWVDKEDGVATRSDLPYAISERNYQEGYLLEISRKALSRIGHPKRKQALSEETVNRFASMHEVSGLAKLSEDVARIAMSILQTDYAGSADKLYSSTKKLTDSAPFAGARRQLDILHANNVKATSTEVINLDALDQYLEGLIGVINRLGRQEISGRQLDAVRNLGIMAMVLRRHRTKIQFGAMADSQNSVILFEGRNALLLENAEIALPQREKLVTPGLNPEELEQALRRMEAARILQQKIAESERQRQEQEKQLRIDDIDQHNAPIREQIATIANDYNQLMAIIYGYSRILLRDHFVVGEDSVEGRMMKVFSSEPIDTIKNAARLYAGLALNAGAITNRDELQQLIEKAAELKAQFEAACSELYPGGSAHETPKLAHDLINDMLWLDANFDDMYILCIAECGKHINAAGEDPIQRVLAFLQRDGNSPKSAEPQIQTKEAPGASGPTLAEVRALAETVDWTILPAEHITVEDLKRVIKDRGECLGTDKTLIDARLQMIVDWHTLYGATIHYSSDKQFDETGDFYFVLTFELDGKKYAIAENPVHGNATYVIARHLMPLLDGESLLTVVKELSRKSIRSLSGRRIIHREGPNSHPKKVDMAIADMSKRHL